MLEDTDVLDYYPLKGGSLPPSSAVMTKLAAVPQKHRNIFQIDEFHSWFMDNKNKSHKEDLSSYYQFAGAINRAPIIRFIIDRLCTDYPHLFKWHENNNKLWVAFKLEFIQFDKDYELIGAEDLFGNKPDYADALDALAMQVPEDLVICSVNSDGNDFVSTAHLMSPAGWSASTVVGKSFAQIHERVTKVDGRPIIKNPSAMVNGIIRMGTPVQRVGAISFRSDRVLNLHPNKFVENKWTWNDDQQVYLRFERQTVIPFPEINSFLFTIKGYWANLLHPKRIDAAILALQNSHPNAYYRNFLNQEGENLIDFLMKKKNCRL